jgi:hypothetical protein
MHHASLHSLDETNPKLTWVGLIHMHECHHHYRLWPPQAAFTISSGLTDLSTTTRTHALVGVFYTGK